MYVYKGLLCLRNFWCHHPVQPVSGSRLSVRRMTLFQADIALRLTSPFEFLTQMSRRIQYVRYSALSRSQM